MPSGGWTPGVERMEGRVLLATIPVTTAADNGDDINPVPGSLRAAIITANQGTGAQTIVFDIPGDGVETIVPTATLPEVTQPVTIDGTTQPGYAGTPLIELDGLEAGTGAFGLVLTGGNSTVRGLDINRFDVDGTGGGILVLNAGNDNDHGQLHRHRPHRELGPAQRARDPDRRHSGEHHRGDDRRRPQHHLGEPSGRDRPLRRRDQ